MSRRVFLASIVVVLLEVLEVLERRQLGEWVVCVIAGVTGEVDEDHAIVELESRVASPSGFAS